MDTPTHTLAKGRRRGPSPAKTAGTRRDIVAAALDLFLGKGFSETRMIDVAERAGVAKGTLYLYFKDKHALFEAVMQDVVAVPVAAIAALEPADGERIRDFLQRIVGPIMKTMESSKRAGVIRLVVAEGMRFPGLAEVYRRVVLEPIVAFMRRLAERARATGELEGDAAVRFPQLLMAPGLIGAIWNGLNSGADEQLDGGALFEAHLDLVFGSATASKL